MKVEIIVARNGLPKVGEVRDFEKSYSLTLIEKGLAKSVEDIKPSAKSVKIKADKKED